MRLSVRLRAIATSAVAVAADACSNSTGPFVDPSSLRASLALVDTVFASPIVRAVGIFLLRGTASDTGGRCVAHS